MESSDDSDSVTKVPYICVYRQSNSKLENNFKKTPHIVQNLNIENNLNDCKNNAHIKKNKYCKLKKSHSTMNSISESINQQQQHHYKDSSNPINVKTSKNRRKRKNNETDTINYNHKSTVSNKLNFKCISKRVRCIDDNHYDDDVNKYISAKNNTSQQYIPKNESFNEMIDSITDCNRMIYLACSNYQNIDDLQKMEWSEAVLIQLSNLHIMINFSKNSWSDILEFINLNQWSIELNYNLRHYIGELAMIHQIITNNHKYKIKYHNLKPNKMFVNIPTIDYELLHKYTLQNSDSKSLKKLKPFPIRIRLKK